MSMIADEPSRLMNANETLAERRAAANWDANLRALKITQPALLKTSQELPENFSWIFGRDGYLTARQDERWWNGCSLPLRAARLMFAKMEVTGGVACFLNPQHPAQIRVALDRLEASKAIIVLLPDASWLRVALSCDDFSAEIASHRLCFAAGADWEAQLRQLLESNPGLATPMQFIRPIVADSSVHDGLVAPAQTIFNAENARRTQQISMLLERKSGRKFNRVGVLAPSHFRLWDDAGAVLGAAITSSSESEISVSLLDSDDPLRASTLALAELGAKCDVIVTANIGRSDLPPLLSETTPWITWVTHSRIPAVPAHGSGDGLLLADPAMRQPALAAGWPSDRIGTASWPSLTIKTELKVPDTFSSYLLMLSDTRPLDPPEKLREYSSHSLLWEAITDEIRRDPFVVSDARQYLDDRRRGMQIDDGNFNASLFINHLILPAYAQSICRMLLEAGLAIQCWGRGWNELEEFREFACGPVVSRQQMLDLIEQSTALLHPWPAGLHPIDSTPRPVLRARGGREKFVSSARLALSGKYPLAASVADSLSLAQVLKIAGLR